MILFYIVGAIDECLYACRNQVAFKQYNPSKPAKYGILFKCINEVRMPFTHRSEAFAGKPAQAGGGYHFKTTEEITLRLVDKVREMQDLQGRNITFDNLYTSIPLAEKLLDRKITLVGTMRHNRKGIPKEIKSLEGREANSSVVFWEKTTQKLTLTSYVVSTKSKGMKNIIVLASKPPLLGQTKDDGKMKPAIIKFYDFSKGGTDIVDQRAATNTTSTKSCKWSKKVMSYMLDVSRVNAQTIFCLNKGLDPRNYCSSTFAMSLGMAMVIPHMSTRRRQNGIPTWLIKKMDIFLPAPEVLPITTEPGNSRFPHPSISGNRRICRQCLNSKTSRQEKNRLPKNQSQCQRCAEAACKDHTSQVCTSCLANFTVVAAILTAEREVS